LRKTKHSKTTPIFYWIYEFTQEICKLLFRTNLTNTKITSNHHEGIKKSTQKTTWNKDTELRLSEDKEKFTEVEGSQIHIPLKSKQLLLKTDASNTAVGAVCFH
jgi:hypothetical protein